MKRLISNRKLFRAIVPLLVIMLISAFTMSGCSQGDKEPSAVIITNAALETMAEDEGDASAIVLKDGKIAYVGDEDGAMEYDDGDAQVIDAGGNTVMPAMTEAHMHFSTAIQAKYEIDLADIIDVGEMQDIISDFVEENPDLDVYAGAGWMVSAFENGSPTKDILDEVCSDKPMVLQEVDGHAYWSA